MSDNNLAGYKAINLVKSDYMWMVGVSVNVDVSRALCRHQLIFATLTWNKRLSIIKPFLQMGKLKDLKQPLPYSQ